jgi:Transposase DDE domain
VRRRCDHRFPVGQGSRGRRQVSSRDYDAGKKINGRKRHIAVDTIGLLLTVLITAAGVLAAKERNPAVEPAESIPLGQAHLRRRRVRWQARHLGQ